MIRVREVRILEDCYDGSRVRELVLEAPIDEALMRAMAGGSELRYVRGLANPVFRIRRAGRWALLGVIGSATVRATFPPAAPPDAPEALAEEIGGTLHA